MLPVTLMMAVKLLYYIQALRDDNASKSNSWNLTNSTNTDPSGDALGNRLFQF